MARVLNATTIVRDPRTMVVVTLRDGDPVPEWAEDLVGDHLTVDGGYVVDGEATGTGPEAGASEDTAPAADAGGSAAAPPPAAPTAPPRAGRGSNVEAWQAYAAELGVEVPDGASRDAIVELVDEYLTK